MRKIDFQDAIHDYQPCATLGTVLKYICDKHGITRQDFIVLLEIHSINEFTWNDFATAELTASWDKRRFYRWKDEGLVELYRAKDGKFRKYNLYRCTRKTKTMVREFYDLLSGKLPIPTLAYSTNQSYSSNRLVRKIEIQKKQDDEKV